MKIVEPKLSSTAKKIAEKRYLRTDMSGKVVETPGEMLYRVARHIAKAEIQWNGNGIVNQVALEFYDRMVNFKFVCAGKAMFEAGNPGGTGQLSSCFVLPIEDNIQSIFKTLGDAAVVHKNNGGTGFNFSHIRPRGDKVKNVPGAASGPVDFLAAYSAALSKILQGAKRRGANIGILNADHPDIEDFIRLKDEDGTIKNFNISVGVTDEFMTAVVQDKTWNLVNPRTGETAKKLPAKKLFKMIVDHAYQTGDPGLMFLDAFNRDNPTPQIGRIEATNPCITGDALISTARGLVRFDDLYQKYHRRGRVALATDHRTITGGGVHSHWSQGLYDQGEKQVYRLITQFGFCLRATGDHKVMTEAGWKQLRQLSGDDRVLIQSAEGNFPQNQELPFAWSNQKTGNNGRTYHCNLPLKWSQELGQLLGWLVGDGFIRLKDTEGYTVLTFGKGKEAASSYFSSLLSDWYGKVKVAHPTPRTVQVKNHSKFFAEYLSYFGVLPVRSDRKRVPQTILTAPRSAVIGFLRGLFSSDGTVNFVPGKSAYVRLTSKSKQLLQEVQLLLVNLGIISRIYNRSRPPRKNLFPKYVNTAGKIKRYGSGGVLWELEISKTAVVKFLDKIGFMFNMHQEKIGKLRSKTYYQSVFSDRVISIMPAGKTRVYDLTEPITHSFIANGMVVSNCGEIGLLPYESCNLTSICLQNHLKSSENSEYSDIQKVRDSENQKVKSSGTLILRSSDSSGSPSFPSVLKKIDWPDLEKSVRLGVRFLDDMIEVNTYAIPEIQEMVKNGNRRIGLGVMGFAHMLVKLGIPYNSGQAVELSEKLAKFIRGAAQDESMKLAKVRGNFPNWDRSIYFDKHPMRNCAVTMIAPTGTTAMLADTTSGIEPIFALVTKRKTFFEGDRKNRSTKEIYMIDPVFKSELSNWLNNLGRQKIVRLLDCYIDSDRKPEINNLTIQQSSNLAIETILNKVAEGGLSTIQELPDWFGRIFVTTHQIVPDWHVKIQAAWQKHFDNSISKTVNFPHHAAVADVAKAYLLAWKLGCKGITIYRDGSKKDQVLNLTKGSDPFVLEAGKPGMGVKDICPECAAAIIAENGCVTCHSCGWSKCSV